MRDNNYNMDTWKLVGAGWKEEDEVWKLLVDEKEEDEDEVEDPVNIDVCGFDE